MAAALKEKPKETPPAPVKAGGIGEGVGEPEPQKESWGRPDPVLPPVPDTFGGRKANVGDMVLFWESVDLTPGAKDTGKIRPIPAMLYEKTMTGWSLTLLKWRHLAGRSGVQWAAKPTMGCWTWKD